MGISLDAWNLKVNIYLYILDVQEDCIIHALIIKSCIYLEESIKKDFVH